MNGQKKGGCGHFMAEWDQHVSCPACRDCVFPDRPCPVCLAFSPEQRELASSARCLRLQRQKRKAAKASSRAGSVSGTAGSCEGDGVGLPRLTPFPTVAGQGGEEESVESGPLPIDESVSSPRPTRSRVESGNTSRPWSRDGFIGLLSGFSERRWQACTPFLSRFCSGAGRGCIARVSLATSLPWRPLDR